MWGFRLTADLSAFRQIRKRLVAHILEFRLFYDEPALVWRAQIAVIRQNLRLLALLVPPLLILTLPMAWILLQMEAAFAYQPLTVGAPAVVTAQFTSAAFDAELKANPEIAVETTGVRSLADQQISWRIRPLRSGCGTVRLETAGLRIEKNVCAGTRGVFLTRRRVESLMSYLLHPEEARLPAGPVAWIEVDYPHSDGRMAEIVIISFFSAAIFGRLFRVPL